AVPHDELAEALWGETPPATWEKALSVLVSKLRGLLADRGIDGAHALTGAFGCYRLDLPEGTWVDVLAATDAAHEAEHAIAAGELERTKAAASLAATLLDRPFLPGEEGEWVEEKRREFADLRERALTALAEACLRSGDAPEAVQWAEQTVALAPFRETGYRRLMEAHVASGNRAEALRVYEQCRRLLADELGTYPSPETESIYRELLEAPPTSLSAATVTPGPRPPADPVGVSAQRPRRLARGRRSVLALAAGSGLVVGLAAVAGVLFASTRGAEDASAIASPVSGSVGFVEPDSGRVVADIPVGTAPSAVARGMGAIWVSNTADDTVDRIDPETHTIRQTIPVGSGPTGIAFGDSSVWVANSLSGTVSRVDPKMNRVVDTIRVGNAPNGIVHADSSIWVANTGDDTVTKIDVTTDRPLKPIDVAATELAVGDGAIWATDAATNHVARIDPSTGDLQSVTVGNGPTGIAFASGSVWVANSLDGTVTRIDPETNAVAAVTTVGNGPTALAADRDGVWVSNQFDGSLVRLDLRTSQVAERVRIGNQLHGLATFDGRLVVGIGQSSASHRGGTLTVRNPAIVESIDTAVAYSTTEWMLLRMTNDGLVAFNETSGPAGARLVPDLAVSLPTPTDRGKTYVFRLRRNIRYSTGKTVAASDVRATFERYFAMGGVPYYDGIVGAARCKHRPKACSLSHGIVANDAARTVTFHLVAPDPDFLYKLALPFAYVLPTGTPAHEVGRGPLPSTGPYVIASYRPQRTVEFVRNRYFHEWSKAAQPDGHPDRILFEMVESPDRAVNDVLHGRADAFGSVGGTPSPRVLRALRTRFAGQVHSNTYQRMFSLFLNTRVPPFDSLDARRALNYAADRAAAVRIAGGPEVAQATCQVLPPNFPGYRPYCPYSAGTSADGTWTAPDLEKARALVAASGTRGMKVTFWAWAPQASLGAYAVKLLRSLGYRASLKVLSRTRYFAVADDPRTKAQIGFLAWTSDYPAPSGFFDEQLTCASFVRGPGNSNAAGFCDPRVDREIEQAKAAQGTNPSVARRLWQRAERDTVDEAPWVPLVSPKIVD
ncbi:MAG TPA: ABC transporter substrate-binding protein, partial [Candidatus Limnocylindrales bacterium]|nr:ABC transporter substrate-binding protein [Candidatus Limnocylindrales bacterium]